MTDRGDEEAAISPSFLTWRAQQDEAAQRRRREAAEKARAERKAGS